MQDRAARSQPSVLPHWPDCEGDDNVYDTHAEQQMSFNPQPNPKYINCFRL
jgi:hypothetical protein